jgi:transposase
MVQAVMDELPVQSEIDESAHTTSRKTARSARVEIITRGERRRVWTAEQKRVIVAESLGPELTPTEVARKHAISSGQLYTWRRELLGTQTALLTRTAPRFAVVEFAAASPQAETAALAAAEARRACPSIAASYYAPPCPPVSPRPTSRTATSIAETRPSAQHRRPGCDPPPESGQRWQKRPDDHLAPIKRAL